MLHTAMPGSDLLERFVTRDDGQDLIEYALLAALIGIAAVLAWQALRSAVGDVYRAADTAQQTQSACTPDPGGGRVGCD